MADQLPPRVAIAETVDAELTSLAAELAEIEMLVSQARAEATRHEQRRAQAAERLASMVGRDAPPEIVAANDQLLALTRRATVMEAQLDVLGGKQRTLQRYQDTLLRVRALVDAAAEENEYPGAPAVAEPPDVPLASAAAATSPAISQVVLAAQEDLRRDIARAMHDGPAQSLTNIVLQAQIVERLLDRDPPAARAEVRELTAMVQRTLEATKTFIFDVRPMVLDDLGLVPTLRRLARDQGRRSQVPVEFDSLGTDRRLSIDLESAIFRVADEAVRALVAGNPDKVVLRLDWGDELEVAVRAIHPAGAEADEEAPRPDMLPALRQMIDERRAQVAADSSHALFTPAVRREIEERGAAVGARVAFAADGHAVIAHVPLPADRAAG